MSRRSRMLGCVLTLLAVLALHLHGLHPYQAGMLLGTDVCSAANKGLSSPSPSGAALHLGSGCGLCCAPQPAVMAANGTSAIPALPRPPRDSGVVALATPVAAPPWPAHRPRGPPLSA